MWGTIQISFAVVNVFLLSASDSGDFCMESSNPCESVLTEGRCLPTFTIQDICCVCLVYLCLLLPLTLCTLSCTSAYCYHWHCVPCVPLPTATTDTILTSSFRPLRSIISLRTFCHIVVLLPGSLSLICAVTQNWSTNQSIALNDRTSQIAEYCRLSF
jgi:hypothetical protein